MSGSNNLTDNLVSYCRQFNKEWIASGALQRMELKDREGVVVTPQTIGRTLRSLEEQKKLAVKYMGPKHHAHYKYLPEFLRKHYRPIDQRKDKKPDDLFNISATEVNAIIAKYSRRI